MKTYRLTVYEETNRGLIEIDSRPFGYDMSDGDFEIIIRQDGKEIDELEIETD